MKIFRYAGVGATAAVVDFLIFAIFAKLLNFNYLAVGAVGFIIATTINYFLSVRFVFESGVRFGFKKEILLDYKIAVVSRECSVLGRREVLTGKAKFGIFGDGKEVPQLAMAKAFLNGWFGGEHFGFFCGDAHFFAVEREKCGF